MTSNLAVQNAEHQRKIKVKSSRYYVLLKREQWLSIANYHCKSAYGVHVAKVSLLCKHRCLCIQSSEGAFTRGWAVVAVASCRL